MKISEQWWKPCEKQKIASKIFSMLKLLLQIITSNTNVLSRLHYKALFAHYSDHNYIVLGQYNDLRAYTVTLTLPPLFSMIQCYPLRQYWPYPKEAFTFPSSHNAMIQGAQDADLTVSTAARSSSATFPRRSG